MVTQNRVCTVVQKASEVNSQNIISQSKQQVKTVSMKCWQPGAWGCIATMMVLQDCTAGTVYDSKEAIVMTVTCIADPLSRPVRTDFVSNPLTAYSVAPNTVPKVVEAAKFATISLLLPFMNLMC